MMASLIDAATQRPAQFGEHFEIKRIGASTFLTPPRSEQKAPRAVVEVREEEANGYHQIFISSARMTNGYRGFATFGFGLCVFVTTDVVRTSSRPLLAALFGCAVSSIIMGAYHVMARMTRADADSQVQRLVAAALPDAVLKATEKGYVIVGSPIERELGGQGN